MRQIEYSSAFKKDYKKAKATPRHRHEVDALVEAAVGLLLDGKPPSRDHALAGNWAGYRECHLKPDLLMIYSKPNTDTLRLARLGSHSELFG